MLSFESPVKTPWHRLRPGPKLSLLCVASVVLFAVPSLTLQAIALLACVILYAVCGWVVTRTGIQRLRIVLPFLFVLLVWHGFTQTYMEGLIISVRLVTLVALSNLITMTTRLTDLMEFLNTLFSPFSKLGVGTRPLELAIALVVRFTPALAEKGHTIASAWRARSSKRPGWQIIFPLSLVAIDDAEHVAEALKARGGLMAPVKSAAVNKQEI